MLAKHAVVAAAEACTSRLVRPFSVLAVVVAASQEGEPFQVFAIPLAVVVAAVIAVAAVVQTPTTPRDPLADQVSALHPLARQTSAVLAVVVVEASHLGLGHPVCLVLPATVPATSTAAAGMTWEVVLVLEVAASFPV